MCHNESFGMEMGQSKCLRKSICKGFSIEFRLITGRRRPFFPIHISFAKWLIRSRQFLFKTTHRLIVIFNRYLIIVTIRDAITNRSKNIRFQSFSRIHIQNTRVYYYFTLFRKFITQSINYDMKYAANCIAFCTILITNRFSSEFN